MDLLIAKSRISLGYGLKKAKGGIEEDIRRFEVYLFAGDLLSRSLGIPLEEVSDQEITQLAFTILSIGYTKENHTGSQFERLAIQLIDKVSDLSEIDFNNDSYLQDMIANHMRPMLYRLKNDIKIENQTTEEIKKRYSILFNMVWLASKIVSDQYDLQFSDAEIAFLTIYFEIAVEKLEKPLVIYVVCPHGLATSELIMNTLRQMLSPFDHLKKIELSEVTEAQVAKADILISSVVLEAVNQNYILVSPLLTRQETEKIQMAYQELRDGNRKMLSLINDKHHLNHSVIRSLVDDNLYLRQQLLDKEAAISFLVEQGSTVNNASPRYLASIIAREAMGSTSVCTGVALPHAAPEHVSQSQLMLMSLEEPILWGTNWVSLIILIAIKEGEEERYKDALIYLYSKIDDRDFIDTLAKMEDEDLFMKTLFEKET
ncbi:BglG family transcription antiterminator [Streptococcus ictaluri]|uniref:BglG family transcription antiterminator n=1 Tax=Streptococcus ictaluri TaxID=380397 RepID=UPI001F223941|nr:PTS sugar transporter subunit IIA [Streptococcus ictaluri]